MIVEMWVCCVLGVVIIIQDKGQEYYYKSQQNSCVLIDVNMIVHFYRFGTAKFLSVNHVVCPDLNSTQPTNGTLLLIDVFSTSPTDVDYTLEVQPIPMFEVSFEQRLE